MEIYVLFDKEKGEVRIVVFIEHRESSIEHLSTNCEKRLFFNDDVSRTGSDSADFEDLFAVACELGSN